MTQSCRSEELKKAKEYALLLLKFRPRSVGEIKEKLKRRGLGECVISAVVEDFKRRGLLDDAVFAKAWVRDRMSLKPQGRLKLKMELKAKGVEPAYIDEALEEASETDEYEIARNLAKRRAWHSGRMDKPTLERRLLGFLRRRGFSYDIVNKVVKEVTKSESRHNS